MTEVTIYADERYPVFSVYKHIYPGDKVLNLSEEDLKRFEKAEEAYDLYQDELETLYKSLK